MQMVGRMPFETLSFEKKGSLARGMLTGSQLELDASLSTAVKVLP